MHLPGFYFCTLIRDVPSLKYAFISNTRLPRFFLNKNLLLFHKIFFWEAQTPFKTKNRARKKKEKKKGIVFSRFR